MLLFYLLLMTAFFDLVLGFVVFKNNSVRLQNRIFGLFVFFGSLWAIGDALMLYTSSPLTIDIGTRLFLGTPVLTTIFVVVFSKIFPHKQTVKASYIRLLALPAAVFLLISLINPSALITSVTPSHPQNKLMVDGVFYTIYTAYFSIYLGYSCWSLFRSYRKAKGIEKSQVGFSLIAIMVSSAVSALTNLTLPLMGIDKFVWAGPISTLFFATAISFSIIRHKLFDIRLIVARSLGYLLSLGLLVASFFGLSYLAGLSLSGLNIARLEVITNAVLIVFGALSYSYVKRFFDKVTNRIFYRDAYDAQAFLDQLNKVLVANVDLKSLLLKTSEIIQANIKSDFVVFNIRETPYHPRRVIGSTAKTFTAEDIDILCRKTEKTHERVLVTDELPDDQGKLQERLRKYDISVLTRLLTAVDDETEGVGYLMLGVKKSGNPYSKQDVKVLGIVANELVIAIQNALRFEEIEQFTLTLQQKVDDATHKLVRTNEKLKALDETKDEFISMASHQLRTPLTSVKGYLSMVLEGDVGKVPDSQRKMLDQAFISSQRMVYLIADLLNVSRLRTGKFVIEPVACNLADVIEGEVGQLKETAASRNLDLIYKKPKEFPTLMLDETKIRQVAMNFMDNAIYYTPAGGKIVVDIVDKGSSIEYTVTDNGLGVPKADQQHLFNKFYRAGNARKARPDGTGLGLFMAKKVVIASGGAIIFRSQEGKGSTFGFTFPKHKLLPLKNQKM